MFDKVRGAFRSQGKMRNVAIIGANSLLGQHIFSRLTASYSSLNQLSVWTCKADFVNRLETNQNNPTDGVHYFVGMNELRNALVDCDTVFNVYEFQDFSNTPDKAMLEEHNIEFVKQLLVECNLAKVSNLVHASSIYLQCSSWWPNVGSREMDPKRFIRDNPCPAYFNTKYEAEQLILENDQLKSIIARVGPLYGEGDRCSIICDAIKLSKWLGPLPLVGDLEGAVQLTYAGNAADAFVKSAEILARSPQLEHETINICDLTPVQSLFDSIARDCYEAGGNEFLTWQLPFWLFFPIYFMLSMLGYLISFVPKISNPFGNMPSASFVYFWVRQWTFFSDYRLRLFLDYKPTYSDEEALNRSLRYYGKQLYPENIKSYSWRTTSEI